MNELSPTPIQGLLPLCSAFLVVLAQLVPEHSVRLIASPLRSRTKHFPALFVFANILSGPLLGTWTALWLSWFGFVTCWVYLRFYKSSGVEGEGRGDASDTFAFTALFPDVLHPVLAPVCDGVYNVMVGLRVVRPLAAAGAGEGRLPSTTQDVVVAGNAEADRRRALALRALDERLAARAAEREGAVGVSSTTIVPPGETAGGGG